MTMHVPTHAIVNLLVKFPHLGGILGLIIAVMFGYQAVASWQELQTMPQTPPPLSLAEAVTTLQSTGHDQWVSLNAVAWDCDNIVQEGDRATAIFTDETRSVLGLATISKPRSVDVACSNLGPYNVAGILRPLGDGEVEHLPGRGFDLASYGGATARVGLCTFCGRSNSRLGVILAAIMVPLGLAMYPMLLRLRRQQQK